ncbi:MAG: 50S ribosomal protein L4 [Phycisphaeraceae bacterium]|nr:50S ribosomal protein L4 [Phycisphaeraceae bacterium]
MDVTVFNMQGQSVGTLTIDEKALGGEINAGLIKQAYVRYHSNLRQGSSRTKNRQEVEGSTRKIYKQKGTGGARHGDRKANIFKGGGHGHSKKKTREDFRLDMPKKMRRKANRNALLAKLMDNEVKIVDSIALKEPKTKDFSAFLEAIKVDASALVALGSDASQTKNARLSARNIDGVSLVHATDINAFNMLNHRYLVITKAELEAWLTGPSSQTGKDAKVDPKGAEAAASKNLRKDEPKAPKAEKPAKKAPAAKTKEAR